MVERIDCVSEISSVGKSIVFDGSGTDIAFTFTYELQRPYQRLAFYAKPHLRAFSRKDTTAQTRAARCRGIDSQQIPGMVLAGYRRLDGRLPNSRREPARKVAGMGPEP